MKIIQKGRKPKGTFIAHTKIVPACPFSRSIIEKINELKDIKYE